ncbi:putative tricarboxylic transport membrane protein [Murinocardiopsis flavida]|uniref:Putative tricarboxylic transport membrane protein n=1 Tax=Murinocardiopsis flavida TaxID=645275 RepID=A0A2P8DS51_9ACTN|nr:tripartite tricarboxylate transporter TctB family protein [Murinocardiopsis flavida]PSL00046.1 putative tricarboxylic transport membrane protein [Murinocardiopsis flavida]
MDATAPATPPSPDTRPRPGGSWLTGRSELAVAALLLAMAAFLAWQTATMHVPPETEFPGPRFFPVLVTILMTAAGIALAVLVAVKPPVPAADDSAPHEAEAEPETNLGHMVQDQATGTHPQHAAETIDWRTVGIVVGALVVFIVLLEPVGWLLSGAVLFFGVSYALGGRRIALDIGIALVFSSVVQLLFVGALGLNLPAGILGGIL